MVKRNEKRPRVESRLSADIGLQRTPSSSEPEKFPMKKTDLYKNLGLSVANKMKNAAKVKGPGSGTKAKTKQQLADELVKANPLLAAFSGKPKSKPPNEA